ncbi:MAG: hypothetical protein ACFFCI_09275 [Promethearchaeota archaeon]
MCERRICMFNENSQCTIDWGACCFKPDPEKLEYLKVLAELFGDG